MADTEPKELTLQALQEAVTGNAAAFRVVTRMEPAGGPDDKVFPPTYAGGVYAMEDRRIRNGDGQDAVVRCVLLDAVQSQANRMEEALLDAYGAKQLKFPLMVVDFTRKQDGGKQDDEDIRRIGRITTLEAPHRIADAIFRDSVLEGNPFRESPQGKAFENATIRNATALFELCPTALIFGTWDSTGSRGGLGNKFARAVVSEVVGVNATVGVRTSSRIDPLGIEKCELYEAEDGGWTVDSDQAKKEKGEPVRFGPRGADKGKPSAINHGNVTPDFPRYSSKDISSDNRRTPNPLKADGSYIDVGEIKSGGVTISYAVQTTVLSLASLRRLRFPDENGKITQERNEAARTVLAALATAAIVYNRQAGCDLRSRCLLVPANEKASLELVQSASNKTDFHLKVKEAAKLLTDAVEAAKKAGLSWREKEVVLYPSDRLVELVCKGREVEKTEES